MVEKKHANYFEGILQLREFEKEHRDYIVALFESRPDAEITREEKVRNGVDFYVTSQKFLRGLGHKLQEKFGGEIKNSRKLHTRDKSTQKELYRAYLMFRPSKYKKGDIVVHRGEKIEIISATKEIFGRNLETGKKAHIKWKDL